MAHFEALDAFLDAIPKNYLIPAVDMMIVKDGREIYRHKAGYADKKRTRPASEKDLYAIYSSTKISTCVAALRLIEEGKLSLDDPVGKYIPAFNTLTVKEADGTVRPAKTVMTVEHLMSMRGGLDYDDHRGDVEKLYREKGPDPSTVDCVATFAEGPLLFDPGTHFRYSLCHDVLAGVIEVASGMKYSEYLKKVIFDPLGMTHTTFHPTEEERANLSWFVRADYERYELSEADPGARLSKSYESGGGGLFSTTDDYMELMYALANGGVARNGYRVLQEESVERYRTPELSEAAQEDFLQSFPYMKGYTYCLGVRRMLENPGMDAPLGNFGWDGAAGFYVLSDPANKIAMIYAQNVMNSGPTFTLLHGQIRDLAYLCMRESGK